MPDSEGAKSRSLVALVERLRMIQLDLADPDFAARKEHLDNMVRQAVNELDVSARRSFLEELAILFPTWSGGTVMPLRANATGTTQTSLSSHEEWNDPSALMARLVELTGKNPMPETQALSEKMRAGLSLPAPVAGAWPKEILTALRRALQLPDQRKLDAGRAMELTVLLADFASRMHQSVWNTWETGIAPNGEIRKRSILRATLARFLSGDVQVTKPLVADDLDKLHQLVAALSAAVKEAGKQFALRVMKDKFNPDQIRDNVLLQRPKKKMFGPTVEEQCWEKYKDLFQAMDERMVEDEIMRVVAEFTEGLLWTVPQTEAKR